MKLPSKENNWTKTNYSRYCNPEYDALWQQSTTELDPEVRQDLFIQMNDMLIEEAAVIPLVHRADAVGGKQPPDRDQPDSLGFGGRGTFAEWRRP